MGLNSGPVTLERTDTVSWAGEPAILLGTGPSLKGFDHERLRGLGRLVAINEAFRCAYFFDVLVSGDRNWPQHGGKERELEEIAASGRLWLGIDKARADSTTQYRVPGAHYIETKSNHAEGGLSDDPALLRMGYSSGFVALNFAYQRKASPIFLFGFDYCYGPGGEHHVAGPDGKQLNGWLPVERNPNLTTWANHFRTTGRQFDAAAIQVLNCNPASVIDAFPRITIEEGIRLLRELKALQRGG